MAKEKSAIELMEAMEKNEVLLGCKVVDTYVMEGSEKRDKEGNLIIDNQTGEVQKWADSYYAKVAFVGGELNVRLKPEQYQTIEVDKRYIAKGRVIMKNSSNGKPYPTLEFLSFEFLT